MSTDNNCLYVCVQSPDGKYIACGAIDGIIYIFEVISEKLIHTLEGQWYVITWYVGEMFVIVRDA